MTTTDQRTIDLVALAADLAQVGWARVGVNYFVLEDTDTIHWRERRYIGVVDERVDLGWESRDYHEGANWWTASVPVNVMDTHWQTALDLIRKHTNGAQP